MTAGSVFGDDASRSLEAAYQTPDVIAQRQETLRALALQPSGRVLDIGAGPGLLFAEMAQSVGPSGHVTGLEISDSMLALGRARVNFVKADAVALPFADEVFDVAVSTQVYEYVADLKAALAELHRVLRSGGRALILDTGWDSIVWNAADHQRVQRLLTAWMERFADPHLHRTLARRLQDAGFQVDRRQVLVLFNPEYDPDTFRVANGQILADFAVARQRMTRDGAEAWIDNLSQLGRGGRYFFSLNRYLFLATKAP